MNPIENKKIEHWKNQLLDTGKRNKMINYRETSRATLKIVEPDLDVLFENYVSNENELTFQYPIDKDSDIRTYSILRLLDKLSRPIHVYQGDIKVSSTYQESRKTLKNLRNKSKLALEEQGTNILYLSLGFIEWQENHGSHHSWVKSPLILIPVSLNMESLNAPFKLVRYDDDVVVNPTLQHLLLMDYGIELPEFNPDNDSAEGYLTELEEIADKKGWRIIREASIGLLSFLKINMYKDLENNVENIQNNAVLKAMLGDSSKIKNIPEELKDYNHDTLKPKDCFQVLSADSSQQDAIELSKHGISFVMQGPPGTGKSQTITNIIAEALADNKKVLFVSEKMAALQVVYKRLSDLGLAEFCLALHSHKANKKQILDDIQNTLSLKKTKVKQEALEELDKLNFERAELNQYVSELHDKIAPLNISCYAVYGILDNLKNATNVLCSFDSVENISREKLNEMIYTLENLDNFIKNSSLDLINNPWKGALLKSLSLDDKTSMEQNIAEFIKNISGIIEKCKKIASENGDKKPITIGELKDFISIAEQLLDISLITAVIYDNADLEGLITYTQNISKKFADLAEHKNIINIWFADSVYTMDIENFNHEFKRKTNEVASVINTESIDLIQDITKIEEKIIELKKKLENIVKTAENDMNLLSLDIPISDSNICSLYALINELKKKPACQKQWFDMKVVSDALSNIKKYKDLSTSINSLNAEILSVWEKEIFDIDYNDLLNKFKTDYRGLFRVFNSKYRADKKEILQFSKNPLAKISDQQIVEMLMDLKQLSELRIKLGNNKAKTDALYGTAFEGENTDWDTVSLDLSTVQKMLTDYPTIVKNGKFQEIMTGNQYSQFTPIYDSIDILSDVNVHSVVNIYNNLFNVKLNPDSNLKTSIDNISEILLKVEELKAYIVGISKHLKSQEISISIFDRINKVIKFNALEKELKSQDEICNRYYGNTYLYDNTNWSDILVQINNRKKVKEIVNLERMEENYVKSIATNVQYRLSFAAELKETKELLFALEKLTPFFTRVFGGQINKLSFEALYKKFAACQGKIVMLEKYIDYNGFKDKCIACGLAEFVAKVEEENVSDIVESFKKRFYILWLTKAMESKPAILNFKSIMHDKTVKDFCILDDHQLQISRMRIREKLINSLPNQNRLMSAHDEMSILTRELSKKRRIMPIRKLFKTIPNLLLKIKPCFMMSPLSVSYFLEAQTYNFDMVIFDEASQIFPEDAIGAILRSKQVIIAGDTKQLPPTNFFASSANNLDGQFDSIDEDDVEDEIFDSILEETESILPNRTLLWHYRSKYEDLIAFSNNHIYKNALITFPKSAIKADDTGVEYYKVQNGIYEDRCNIEEARKCVELIVKHIDKYPERSLGIIAFSEKQQSTIEQVLYEYREQNPSYEWFFDESKEEPFFIKNLENVQGDERDTIIFSICYAKNKKGTMLMNFGPLGKQGGERRLNVAVTRAKINIKLVGSIEPSDIDLNRAKSEGAKLLRSYIEFAIKGSSILQNNQLSTDADTDDFCDCVYDFLVSKGYKVARNIGTSDYKIDLAIEHPKQAGTYIVGIECDGIAYATARTARERDHLRPQILKNMGWNMYRVWSSSWVKNPNEEENRLISFINKCIEPTHKEKVIMTDYTVPVENVEEPTKMHIDNNLNNPYGFKYYIKANWWDAPQNYNQPDTQRAAEVLSYIIGIEQPIHLELLYQRAAGLFGREKVTSVVKNNVDYIMKNFMVSSIVVKDDFVSMANMSEVNVRVSEIITESARNVEHIAIPEIMKAMTTIASCAVGIDKNELKIETARVFGFVRMGTKVAKSMDTALFELNRSGKIRILDEKVHVMEEV